MPNFHNLIGNSDLPEFVDLNYFKKHFNWSENSNLIHRRMFEKITLNECYWDNRDKYKNIALLDTDESIIPRVLESHFTNGNLNLNCQIGQKHDGKCNF